MVLTSVSKLVPYEIASCLGAGDMGEVHRARDSRRGREVALALRTAGAAGGAGGAARVHFETAIRFFKHYVVTFDQPHNPFRLEL